MNALGRWLMTPSIVAFIALFPVWATCLFLLYALGDSASTAGFLAGLSVLWITGWAFQSVRRRRHPWLVWFVAISLLLCSILGNLSVAVPGLGLLFLPSAIGMIAVASSMKDS